MAWWHPEEMPWLSGSRSVIPLPTIMTAQKIGCRGGMVAPWRITLAKSKQKYNAPFPQWQFKKLGVRVAWWHHEEIPWLRRSRSIMSPSHNDNSKKNLDVGEAWWQPEEIPWLSRRRSIMPLPTIMTITKKWCRGGMVALWRNTLPKSKLKHNAPSHNNDSSKNWL